MYRFDKHAAGRWIEGDHTAPLDDRKHAPRYPVSPDRTVSIIFAIWSAPMSPLLPMLNTFSRRISRNRSFIWGVFFSSERIALGVRCNSSGGTTTPVCSRSFTSIAEMEYAAKIQIPHPKGQIDIDHRPQIPKCIFECDAGKIAYHDVRRFNGFLRR